MSLLLLESGGSGFPVKRPRPIEKAAGRCRRRRRYAWVLSLMGRVSRWDGRCPENSRPSTMAVSKEYATLLAQVVPVLAFALGLELRAIVGRTKERAAAPVEADDSNPGFGTAHRSASSASSTRSSPVSRSGALYVVAGSRSSAIVRPQVGGSSGVQCSTASPLRSPESPCLSREASMAALTSVLTASQTSEEIPGVDLIRITMSPSSGR